ncbi:tetratricopeptide repeat protein [Amycolatopsis sp. DG1A-15b]|uniref:tetratricopeptide repeat protein n=1 Tax=Amycolatopsis sp. DG1A-15b TaxID=3052846 RepID=UPI00255B641B|nr:tetratricopeptide repeat protein [Amycolatopsis sp. DG1A-15b]WIX84672.1 tetratricopeptide repeat protein [Amycolatopsis sp. DG1A-15b]
MPVAVLVLFIATGIRFTWFADPAGGAWRWIEAASWIVGMGVGIPSLVLLVLDRRKSAQQATEPQRDPKMLDRDEESKSLRAMLSEPGPGVVTVVGAAGIGKSTLVEAVLRDLDGTTPRPVVRRHTVAPDIRFDVRQLIADIRGRDVSSIVIDEGKSPLEILTAALENATRERIIIVIDAAQHLQPRDDPYLDLQMTELLDKIATDRRHRVTVVLVSTERLKPKTGDHGWLTKSAVDVSWLPRPHFDTLLDRAGLAELRKKRRTLHDQLQGNPGCIPLMEVRNELYKEEISPDELMAPLEAKVTLHDLLQVTIDELTWPRRKAMLALAACGTPVDDKTVVAVLAGVVPDFDVTAALNDLVSIQLVRADDTERYYLPVADPLALLPRTGPERKELLDRAAKELGERRAPEPTGPGDLRLHFAQLRALLAAKRYFVAYDVIIDMVGFLNRWNCGFMLLEQRKELQNQLEDDRLEMVNDSALGSIYSAMGNFLKANTAFGRALAYAEKVDLPVVRTGIRLDFASTYWRDGETESAYNYYELARSDARSQGEPGLLVRALLGLADCHRRWGQYDKAIRRAEAILAMADGVTPARRVRVCVRLARWYSETGDQDATRERLEQARKAAAGDRRLQVLCLDAEAAELLAVNQPDDAKTRATEAVKLALELEDPVVILQARTTLGMAYLSKDDPSDAAPHIEDAMRYRRPCRALIVLALHAVVTQRTDPARARRPFDQLANQARARIRRDRRDFGAYDMLGLAICGSLLDTDQSLDGAIEAFDQSRAITRGAAPLLQDRCHFLVQKLSGDVQARHRLAPVLDALSGTRTRPPE